MSWYNSNWKYRVKITVDKSKVGSDLTDFPVYVDLSTLPSGFHTNVKSDGGDIRVTRSDGTTECPREVVFYDSTNDKGELHFKANSLSSTTDTVFYIYYGNASATEPAVDSTYGRNPVWSNYKAVYHMNQDPTGTVIDSSGNTPFNANVDLDSNDLTTGKLGSGIKKDTGEYFRNATGISFSSGSNVTFQAWMYPTGKGAGANPGIWRAGNTSTGTEAFNILNGTTRRPWIRWATTDILKPATGYQIPENEWTLTHWVIVSNSSATFYANGSSQHTASHSKVTSAFSIMNLGWQYSLTEEVLGTYDEVRFIASALSADWISAEYTNQATPTTFYTIGTQESGSTEVNSIRGLYMEVINTGNSMRGLYLLGSQVLSTDYFNVVFSEPSINDFSERGLYIKGYGINNSEKNLYTSGFDTNNSSRPLYIQGLVGGNSGRGLYVKGYGTDLSERRLYITGSTSGSGDRTLYVCGLISNGSERSLYLQGSLSSNSERGLLLEGKPVIDERGLYLLGYIYTSSTRDLYLGGIDTGTSERNLYTQGTSSSTSNRSFYIQGSISTNNERGLYLIGKSLEGERELYLHGFETGSSEKKLYLEGANVGYDNRGLYIQGYLSDSSSRGLYLYGYGVGTPERALHIAGVGLGASERGVCVEGKDIDVSERGLYIQGSLEDGSNRKLYLEGYISANIERTLYIQGQETLSSSMPLYIWGYEVGSFERNLYIQGYDIKSLIRGLYIQGYLSDNSDRELYLFGYDIETSERGLYLVGLDLGTSERSIYLESKDMGASERDLYVHGFVRSFSNRGLYIVGDGEVPFHEGNVIIKIDEGLYLNPKTGRIYVAIE